VPEVRLLILARQTCPRPHVHQTTLSLWGFTSAGVSGEFSSKCHSDI